MRKYGTAAAVMFLALMLAGCTRGSGLFTKTYTIGKQISSGQIISVVSENGELLREADRFYLVKDNERQELDVPHWNMLVHRLDGKTAHPVSALKNEAGLVQVVWTGQKEPYGIRFTEAEYVDFCDAMERVAFHTEAYDPVNLTEVSLRTSGGMNGGMHELTLKKEHGQWILEEVLRETHNSRESRTVQNVADSAALKIRDVLEAMDWVEFKDLPPSELQALDAETTTLSFRFEPSEIWNLRSSQELSEEAGHLMEQITRILQEASGEAE